jgi:hypothetical protein
MISKKLENRALAFFESIEKLPRKEKIKECRQERNNIISEYSETYARSIFTNYRLLIAKDLNYLIPLFKVSKGTQTKIERDYKKKVAKGHKSLIKIAKYKELIGKAKELLGSSKVTDVTLALMVLTGRRPTEILKTAKFTNRGKSLNMLNFSGQLKKKGKGGRFKIYILGKNAKECKGALARLRVMSDTKKMSNNDVSRRYKPQLFMRCTFLFRNYLGACTPHDLRKSYIAIASEIHKPKNQSLNSFASELLGHNEDDINTANSYQKYYI